MTESAPGDPDETGPTEEHAEVPPRVEAPRRPPRVERGRGPRIAWVILALGVALGGFALFRVYGVQDLEALPPAPRPPAVLDAAPAGATLVVTADVAALRRSSLFAPYLEGDRSVEGLGTLRAACGFDPISTVDTLALVVPETGDADFGLIATGSFDDAAVLECAAKVVSTRSGRPVTSSVGTFRSVRDLRASGTGELAVRRGGPLLIGGGAYLRQMIDTADGTLPSVEADVAHAELRSALGDEATIRLSLVLSARQRATVADEIAKSGGRAPPALGAIGSAGVGVRVDGDRARVALIVRCDDPLGAAAVLGMVREAKRSAQEGQPAALLGAAGIVQRVSVEAEGRDVRATLDVGVTEIEAIVNRATELRALIEAAGGG